MINDICIQICTAALEDVIGAIEWDIEEVINVSFDDMHNVFNSEKFRKVISTKIMDSIPVQPSNAYFSITVTFLGITMLLSEVQPPKAE